MNGKKAKKLFLKSTKNRDKALEDSWSPFRAAEKRFKARYPPLQLNDVIDFGDDSVSGSGVTELSRGVYSLTAIPGLVLLPKFVSEGKQRDLIKWALRDHARYPNETNLDAHYSIPESGLWNQPAESIIQPKQSDEPPPESGPRVLIENTPVSPDNFKTLASEPKPAPPPAYNLSPATASSLVPKLRWANIGWHYHWGTKQYDFARPKTRVDPELDKLCKSVVRAVNWNAIFGEDPSWSEWKDWEKTYEPDAGIVNYYQLKNTLMAHVDRSEVCATSPLISISLGNSAIFLIGGQTRDVAPVPILLRSGDVIVMSGPVCRRAYHGVPRIIEGTLPEYLSSDAAEMDWTRYGVYIRSSRININVRQVFPKGFTVTPI